MAYYQGDYYRGDPGIFGAIGSVLKTGLGVAGTVLPGPLGSAARLGRSFFGKRSTPTTRSIAPPPARWAPRMPMVPQPDAPGPGYAAAVGVTKRRRRMNVTNPKALRRAIRREQGFVKLARKALRGTGYSVVSKASRARRTTIKESGAGSVTVQ